MGSVNLRQIPILLSRQRMSDCSYIFTIARLQEIENNPTQVQRAHKGWKVSILKSIFNVTVSIFRLKLIDRKIVL